MSAYDPKPTLLNIWILAKNIGWLLSEANIDYSTTNLAKLNRMKIKMKIRLLALSTIVALYGCTTSAPYNPEYIVEQLYVPPVLLDGKALIWTTQEDDECVHHQWNLSLGKMTREISLNVFSGLFKEGAEHSNSLENLGDYSVVITVRPEDFKFENTSSLAQSYFGNQTYDIEMSLQLMITASNGEVVHQDTYHSGTVSNGPYLVPWSLSPIVSKTVHNVITEILNRVAQDTHEILISYQSQ